MFSREQSQICMKFLNNYLTYCQKFNSVRYFPILTYKSFKGCLATKTFKSMFLKHSIFAGSAAENCMFHFFFILNLYIISKLRLKFSNFQKKEEGK